MFPCCRAVVSSTENFTAELFGRPYLELIRVLTLKYFSGYCFLYSEYLLSINFFFGYPPLPREIREEQGQPFIVKGTDVFIKYVFLKICFLFVIYLLNSSPVAFC